MENVNMKNSNSSVTSQNVVRETVHAPVSLRDKKIEQIRKEALADAQSAINKKSEEVQLLHEKLENQERRFNSVSKKQSKVVQLTRDKLEAEREFKLKAFDNIRRMATQINSNEDMPGRESVVERLPSHYGLSNHQRSQSSIGTFNQSRPSSSAKVRTRPHSSMESPSYISLNRNSMSPNLLTAPKGRLSTINSANGLEINNIRNNGELRESSEFIEDLEQTKPKSSHLF